MRGPAVRLTIRSLMVAVAVVAGVLALFRWLGWLMAAIVSLELGAALPIGRLYRGARREALMALGVVAVPANMACVFLSVRCQGMGGGVLTFLVWFLAFPVILGLGAAWAAAATRRNAVKRRPPLLAWSLVLVLAILPLTILIEAWPFRLAFLASRPALDRLADQVAAGSVPRFPVDAGAFRVFGSAINPRTGNVGLIVDPDPSGRSGFVRLGPGRHRGGPFHNLNHDLSLGDGWWYECED